MDVYIGRSIILTVPPVIAVIVEFSELDGSLFWVDLSALSRDCRPLLILSVVRVA